MSPNKLFQPYISLKLELLHVHLNKLANCRYKWLILPGLLPIVNYCKFKFKLPLYIQIIVQMSDDDLIRNVNDDDEDSFYGEGKKSSGDEDKKSVEEKAPKSKVQKPKKKKIRKEKGEKRQHNAKDKDKEAKLLKIGDTISNGLITKMNAYYNDDIELYKRKQPAVKKFLFLNQLTKELKNKYTGERFLENGGLVVFEKWLSKIPIKGGNDIQPSFVLRKGIFQILLDLKVKSDHIARSQQLQRTIQKNKRSQDSSLRELSEKIISKWSQLSYDDEE